MGHIIHVTFHPGDVSSKGCVVQGTHRPTTKVQETFVGDGLTLLPKDFTSERKYEYMLVRQNFTVKAIPHTREKRLLRVIVDVYCAALHDWSLYLI